MVRLRHLKLRIVAVAVLVVVVVVVAAAAAFVLVVVAAAAFVLVFGVVALVLADHFLNLMKNTVIDTINMINSTKNFK